MSDNNSTADGKDHLDSAIPPPPGSPGHQASFRVQPRKPLNSELIAKVTLSIALIGSFLPWARVLFFTVNGTDGDGIITAAASGLALILVFVGTRKRSSNESPFGSFTGGAISASLAAIVYVYDFVNLSSISDESSNDLFEISVQPQVGLIGGSIGAVVGALVCIQLAIRARTDRKAASQAQKS